MKFLILLFIVGCVSMPARQKLNPAVYYKNDICFSYEGEKDEEKWVMDGENEYISRGKEKITFCGTGVLPYKDRYKLTVNSFTKLDLFTMTTCHREETTANPDKGIFRRNGIIKIDFVPTLEKGRACPMYVGAFSRTGKHGWGVLAMESPTHQLKATVHCNGLIHKANGVSICQSRGGLMQKIVFPEAVKLAKPVNGPAERQAPCPELKPYKGNKVIVFEIPNRECLYGFIGRKSYKMFQLYTIGYEELIVR